MGKLSQSALEVRLAATLFLLLLGLADAFGALQVGTFASFTPKGVAATLAPEIHHQMAMPCCQASGASEQPVDVAALDAPRHQISRELLVQDTHVHVPAYAMTAAFLALIVFGLSLSQQVRVAIVLVAFIAPFLNFVGLWGAQLYPVAGLVFGAMTIGGGFAMGLAYLVVLFFVFKQCWFPIGERRIPHA
jgi:hypothetical protein